MRSPRYAAAPGVGTEGGATIQRAADTDDSTGSDAVSAAERAYAAALVLVVDDLARDALTIAGPDAVSDPWSAVVVAACSQMLDAGVPRDTITVANWIERRRMVEGFRASRLLSSLHELTADCPLPASVRWYAGIVADYAHRRRAAAMVGALTERIARGDVAEVDRICCALSYAAGVAA